MSDAARGRPPAQGQVASRPQLALKLYKGPQSDSSVAIKQDGVPTNLDRVFDVQTRSSGLIMRSPDPVWPAMAFVIMLQSEIQLI